MSGLSVFRHFQNWQTSGIAIQRKTVTQDTYGDAIATWSTVSTVDGVLMPLTSSNHSDARFFAAQRGYDADYRLYVVATADIKVGDRAVHNGRLFAVNAVTNPMMAGDYLQVDMLWQSEKQA
jgi:head-tail adaptor